MKGQTQCMNFLGAIITGARIVSRRTVLFEEIVIWTVPSKKCMKPPYANQKCFDEPAIPLFGSGSASLRMIRKRTHKFKNF